MPSLSKQFHSTEQPFEAEPSWFADRWHRFTRLADDYPYVPADRDEHRAWNMGWRLMLIILLVAAVFGASLAGEWIWLDEPSIPNDLRLRSLRGLAAIWAQPFRIESPLTLSLRWIEFHIFGIAPGGYRAVSLLMHAGVCGLAWLMLRRLAVPGAWLIAAILAVHPANVSSVAWVTRQGDLLAMFCTLTAVLAYMRCRAIEPHDAEHRFEYDNPSRPAIWALFGLAAVGALLTDASSALLIPSLVFVLSRWCVRFMPPIDRILLSLIGATALSLATVRFHQSQVSFNDRLLISCVSALWIPIKTFWPARLPMLMDADIFETHRVLIYIGAGILVCLAGSLILTGWRKCRPIALATAVFLAFWISGVLCVQAEESTALLLPDIVPYLSPMPLVAFAVMFLLGTTCRLQASGTRLSRWAIGTIVLAIAIVPSSIRAMSFTGSDALWRATLADDPDSIVARLKLAERYLAQDYFEESAALLEQVPSQRRFAPWYLTRGRVHDAQHEYRKSIAMYETARNLNPADASAISNLGDAYLNAGEPELALKLYQTEVNANPKQPAMQNNLGLANMRIGRPLTAAEAFRNALAADPDFIAAHINLANALFELNQPREAAEELQKVVGLDPRSFPAFLNAGVMLYHMKDFARAEQMLRAAVHLSPTSVDAYNDLGIVLAAQNKTSEAAWALTQAVHIDPDNRSARENLKKLKSQLAAGSTTRPATSQSPTAVPVR